jgi:hypothetical protein
LHRALIGHRDIIISVEIIMALNTTIIITIIIINACVM